MSKAKRLAKRLISENQKGRSWRRIALEDYPAMKDGERIIKPGTLNRIAKSEGKWMPKDKHLLNLLIPPPKLVPVQIIGFPGWELHYLRKPALNWLKRKAEKENPS
jgi:hypothetical protein